MKRLASSTDTRAKGEPGSGESAMTESPSAGHQHPHAFTGFHPRQREGLVVASRRNFLKAGWAGLAGLTLPGLLRWRAEASAAGHPTANGKSVILLWMAGGMAAPDTFDPKKYVPFEVGMPVGQVESTFPTIDTVVDNIKITQGLESIASIQALRQLRNCSWLIARGRERRL